MKQFVQIVAALAIAALVVALWRSPSTAASDVGEIIGWGAGLLQEAVGRFADFVDEL